MLLCLGKKRIPEKIGKYATISPKYWESNEKILGQLFEFCFWVKASPTTFPSRLTRSESFKCCNYHISALNCWVLIWNANNFEHLQQITASMKLWTPTWKIQRVTAAVSAGLLAYIRVSFKKDWKALKKIMRVLERSLCSLYCGFDFTMQNNWHSA